MSFVITAARLPPAAASSFPGSRLLLLARACRLQVYCPFIMTSEPEHSSGASSRPGYLLPGGLVLACLCLALWLWFAPQPTAPALSAAVLTALVIAVAMTLPTKRHSGRFRRASSAAGGAAEPLSEQPGAVDGIQAGELRFLKVFRYNPIAMALVRPDQRIAYTNRQFRLLSGLDESALVGRAVEHMVYGNGREALRAMIQRTLDNRAEDEWQEFRFVGTGGRHCWTRLSTECIQDAQGQVIYALVMAEDISERRRFDAERAAYQKRLEGLSRRLLDAQEEERRHVARELHDELGQTMTAIKLGLQTLRLAPEPSQQQIDHISARVDDLIDQVRRLSRELRPSLLDDLGLEAALRWLIDQHRRDHDMHVHFTVEGLKERPSHRVESACFRIVQEALTNVMRHARATAVSVRLRRCGDQLEFSIDDDGCGFDPGLARAQSSGGRSVGLLSMHERVTLLGGEFRIDSEIGLGTRVSGCIPVADAAAEERLSSVGDQQHDQEVQH